MKQESKFFFDISWVLVSSAINLASGFLLRVILARWLGADDLGLYAIVIITQEVATLVASVGISVALTKYVAEYKDNRDQLLQITSASFISVIILSLVGGAVLYILSGVIAGLLNMPELANLLKILSYALPCLCFLESEFGLLNGLRR